MTHRGWNRLMDTIFEWDGQFDCQTQLMLPQMQYRSNSQDLLALTGQGTVQVLSSISPRRHPLLEIQYLL